jgi:hypothetical protein
MHPTVGVTVLLHALLQLQAASKQQASSSPTTQHLGEAHAAAAWQHVNNHSGADICMLRLRAYICVVIHRWLRTT